MASSLKTYPPQSATATLAGAAPPSAQATPARAPALDPRSTGTGNDGNPPAPPPPPPSPPRLPRLDHPGVKLLGLGLLWLLMLVPNWLIESTVQERAARRGEAVAAVSATWGAAQRLAGPFIVVPYTAIETVTDDKGHETREAHQHAALWLPANLELDARQHVERRRKGLFEIPLYRAEVAGTAVFRRADIDAALRATGVEPARVQWPNATLLAGVSGLKSVTGGTRLAFEGSGLKPVAGGGVGGAAYYAGQLGRVGAADAGTPSVQWLPTGLFGAPVGTWLTDPTACTHGCRAELTLSVQGTEELTFLPLGSQTHVRLRSDWPHPAFDGEWLPGRRTVEASGTTAEWTVDELARGYPAAWTTQAPALAVAGGPSAGGFGVQLLDPVDTYAAVTRAVKYAGLTVALVFGTLWLFEMLAGTRLHPVQYALTACALVLFGLVVLALAEHIGFTGAFLAAAATMTAMITLYARAALGAWPRALLLGGVVGALYGGLWLMLESEDNALLGGTGALVGALAVVMWLTRRVDWYRGVRVGPGGGSGPGPASLPPASRLAPA